MNRATGWLFVLLGIVACLGLGCSSDSPDPPPPPAPSLSVSLGFWSKTHVECAADQAGVPAMQIFLSNGATAVTVDTITFHVVGTMNEPSDVLGLVLALDTNTDGRYTAGVDTLLPGSGQTFSGDDGLVTFSPARSMPVSSSETWILAADLSGSAAGGTSMQATLASVADVGVTDTASGAPTTCSGPPFLGAKVDVPSTLPAWTLLAPAAGRYAHSSVYDGVGGRMVVFGGTDGTTSFNDIRVLDLPSDTWSVLSPTGTPPSVRHSHSALSITWSGVGPAMLVFGGTDSAATVNDVHCLTLVLGAENWSAITVSGTPPSPRYDCLPALHIPGGSKGIFCCGQNGTGPNPHLSDFFELDLASLPNVTWSTVTPTQPPGFSLSGQTGFISPTKPGIVTMFGGMNNPGIASNRLYHFDYGAAQATVTLDGVLGGPFPAAYVAGAAGTNGYYVFGGFESTLGTTLGDLYAYRDSPGRWVYIMTSGAAPSPRCHHTMIEDAARSRIILFGGAQWSGSWSAMGDVWELLD